MPLRLFTHVAPVVLTILLSAQGSRCDAQQPVVPSTRDTATGESRPLMPGDVIRLGSTQETELRGDYVIDETGSVVLPLLGSRNVRAIPAAELKRKLASDFEQQLRNRVQIAMLRRVRVVGAVKNPGIYFVDPTMSVDDAVALAGGATEQGKTGKARIIRSGTLVRSRANSTPRQGELRSGDEILVPERSWFSRNGKFVVGGLITAAAIVTASVISR